MNHIQITHDAGITVNWQLDPRLQSGAVVLLFAADVAPSDEPCSTRGTPRTDYAREYWAVPQDVTLERWLEICRQAYAGKNTVGFSYDDAGIGDLTQRKAVLWDIPEIKRSTFTTWFIMYYPGVWAVFNE